MLRNEGSLTKQQNVSSDNPEFWETPKSKVKPIKAEVKLKQNFPVPTNICHVNPILWLKQARMMFPI